MAPAADDDNLLHYSGRNIAASSGYSWPRLQSLSLPADMCLLYWTPVEIKITSLLVTHDQSDAFEVAKHVVVLFEGKVAQAGAPHDIYDHLATGAVHWRGQHDC